MRTAIDDSRWILVCYMQVNVTIRANTIQSNDWQWLKNQEQLTKVSVNKDPKI